MFSAMVAAAIIAIGVDLPHPVQTPASAVVGAWQDVQTLPAGAAPFMRYHWCPPGSAKELPALDSYSVNAAASSASTIQRPAILLDGALVRWDLRQLAPDPKELVRLAKVWDDLAQSDPYFTVRKQAIVGKQTVTVTAFAPHLPNEITQLAAVTNSKAPILRADWCIVKMLTTVDGGQYYNFAGIERSPKQGTAQAAFLASVGADEQKSQQLAGDQRAAMFRSEVTGKPRRIDVFRGVAGRAGTGLVSVTHDVKDGDVDARQNPLLSILRFNDRAREVIAEKNNGLHLYALFDAFGRLQDEVPPNIAADATIPRPHTQRLEPARGCIVCHGPDDGWKHFGNDVATMLGTRNGSRLDVIDDLSEKNLTTDQILDRLAGLYAGGDDLNRKMSRGRDDYAAAVWKATGGMEPAAAAAGIANVFDAYRYQQVGADGACLELGYKVSPDNALPALRWLLPNLPVAADGISPEDGRIAALKAGIKINRGDFEAVFADAQVRANIQLEKLNAK
jgi:hypothetical protein